MNPKFLSQKYTEIPVSLFEKCAVKGREYKDLINFTIGDPDFHTDQRIIEAAFADAKKGHTHYTSYSGDAELIAEIGKFYQEEYGYTVGKDETLIVAGGSQGLYLALAAILDQGDEVIYHEPCYMPYPIDIEMAGGKPVVLPTYEEENFQIDPRRLEALITDRTKALIINTPGNPTGVCFTRETFEEIARIAKKYDLIILADDIYTLYSYAEPFLPITTLEGMRERTVTISSFSKDFAMPGWRVGYTLAPDYITSTMRYIMLCNTFCASSVSQRAALHALRMRKEIQPALVEEFKKRTFYAYERITKMPNMSILPPQGAIYQFINISQTGLKSVEVHQKILDEAHVLVLPGLAFGACGDNHIRIALTMKVEIMKEAFDRIAKMRLFSC